MTESHLAVTFADAERAHPDLMEPYSSRLADAETSDARRTIMEAGLRETFRRRYPMADELWPKAAGDIADIADITDIADIGVTP